jgi:hypothetical protein
MTASVAQDAGPVFKDENGTLLCVVGHMIPPSAEYGVPGACDPAIFADILRSVGRDQVALRDALSSIDTRAGGRLAKLPVEDQRRLLVAFRTAEPERAGVIEAVAARCYYRDDRVMASIGIEVRPPFPLGYEVEQGDWSLLEPVRARGTIYRDAD